MNEDSVNVKISERNWSEMRAEHEAMKAEIRAAAFDDAEDLKGALVALKRARDAAMKHTLVARIPECGVFGEIAQDLDWAIDQLESN
jgi:hypothetical protein